MVVWFTEGKKAYMFNKLFTGTQLASGPVLAALSNHTPTDIKADYNDAYLRRYFLPKLFLRRNEEVGLLFTSEYFLFAYYAKSGHLKDCDLSDFIIRNRNYVRKMPALYAFAAGYKMSDEAAWVLLENPVFPDKEKTFLLSSVWFRAFNEKEPNFENRFEVALEKFYKIHKLIDVDTNADRIEEIHRMIWSFQFDKEIIINDSLGLDWEIGQSLADDVLLSNEVFLWYLKNTEPEHLLGGSRNLAPFILYSPDIPDDIWKKFYTASNDWMKQAGRNSYGMVNLTLLKLKELIGIDGFSEFLIDLSKRTNTNLFPEDFVLAETIWTLDNSNIGRKLIEAYKDTPAHNLYEPRVKVLKRFLKKDLEEKFNITISSNSLYQLISIYESTFPKTKELK